MHHSLFDSPTSRLVIHVCKRLFPALEAPPELDRPWILDDRCQLRFEPAGDSMIIALEMPERHLDLQQLTRLLILPAQGWPLPLAASLCPQTMQPVLFIRMPLAGMDEDLLLQAIASLKQARQRWLAWPATAMHSRDGTAA